MEVLCAYLRNVQNTGKAIEPSEQEYEEQDISWYYNVPPPRVDVQAAISVIGRRPPERIAHEAERGLLLDLSYANLQNVQFDGNFSGAKFSGANLTGTRFTRCEFKGDEFEPAAADFITFSHCKFLQLEMTFTKEVIRWSADGCSFVRAMFATDLSACNFWECDFSNASFPTTKIRHTRFSKCNLTGASFEHVIFENCSITASNLSKTDFSGADLVSVRGLNSATLESTIGNEETSLPKGIRRPSAWPELVDEPEEEVS
jgi:uncharacterized protein YjbI with pentapeptide repeats